MNVKRVAEAIRSSTFGGLVLAGIGIIVHFSFPAYALNIPLIWFITACFTLGTALHKAVEGTVRFLFFNRAQKVVSFHEKMAELDTLLEERRITATMHQHLVNKLCEKRYIE